MRRPRTGFSAVNVLISSRPASVSPTLYRTTNAGEVIQRLRGLLRKGEQELGNFLHLVSIRAHQFCQSPDDPLTTTGSARRRADGLLYRGSCLGPLVKRRE